MGLHTYTVGYGGLALFLGGLFADPTFQSRLVDAIQLPSVAHIVPLVCLVLGATALWIGKGPLSSSVKVQ